MSIPSYLRGLYSPSDGSFSASRTTAAIDLGTGSGRALLVLAMGDGGTPAAYSFTSATVATMGASLTAGAEKTTTGSVRRAFWATDADGLPTGSRTVTVNTNGTRNMFIMLLVFQDGAVSGASIAVTPTAFASKVVSGGANSYTVGSTTTAGLAVAMAACPGNIAADASATNATTYRRDPGIQSFETFAKDGLAGTTPITWQTAGPTTLTYDTFGFALLGSSAGGGAPTLTSPSGTGGTLVCSGSVSTTGTNGTLYAVVTGSATAPTAAQVKLGQDNAGAAALRVISQAVSASGTQTIASGAVTAGTRYMHFMHEDGSANQSTVVSSASFVVTSSAATATTLSGPSSGAVGVASTNFTVGANGSITGTVVVTPSDGGGGGTFTPTTVSISSGSPTGTFTYTPASSGAKTISITNNGGLTNPSSLTYTASTGTAIFSILAWVNNAGASLANTGNINISFHSTSTRALVLYLTGQTINSSGHLTGSNAALTTGSTYTWVAESSTDATAFGAGRVTAT